MKTREQILNRIDDLENQRTQLYSDRQAIEDGDNQDLIEQLDYVDIDIDVLTQKIDLLKWVLNG